MPLDEHIARIAQELLDRADELAVLMDEAILSAAPALGADADLLAETRASTRANLLRWLSATARNPSAAVSTDVPPEALDLARTLVRRGLDTELLLQAYRLGQNVAWRAWMDAAARAVGPGPELVEVLDRSSAQMFAYVDALLAGVLAAAQREREELVGGALARRAETVRLLLDGAPLDVDVASRRLGYELRRRHTAVVLWASPPGDVQGALETAATAVARAAEARRPLLLPAGTSSLWAWLGTDDVPDPERLSAALEDAPPHVRATLGPTRRGATGFRRTHAGAVAAQRLVAADSEGPRCTTFAEVEAVALAGQDPVAAAEFVRSVLGPLAATDAQTARLRETVRAYLGEGEHGPRTAARLGTHRNTILHRIARAEELLGHPIADRRLAIALALELAHRLGPQVLRG